MTFLDSPVDIVEAKGAAGGGTVRAHGPLFRQIASHYRNQILEGVFSEGSRLPSCREAARAFGVSQDTIDRAYGVLVEEGLVDRRRALGTIVRGKGSGAVSGRVAKAAPRRRVKAPIVLMVRKEAVPVAPGEDLFSDYLNGLMDGFNVWKFRFEIANIREGQADLELARILVEEGQACGFINMNIAPDATEYLIQKKMPMVAIGDNFSMRGVTSVVADHVKGYSETWRIVDGWGHGEAAFFGQSDYFSKRLGECAAGRELARAKCRLTESIQVGDNTDSREIWSALIQTFGERKTKWPTLIFAQNDSLAALLIRSLMENGMRVPEDVAVVGFNNSLIARHFNPTITTIGKPRYKIGRAAAELMIDLLANRNSARGALQTFPTHLVERESCGNRNSKQKKQP